MQICPMPEQASVHDASNSPQIHSPLLGALGGLCGGGGGEGGGDGGGGAAGGCGAQHFVGSLAVGTSKYEASVLVHWPSE